MISTLDHSVCAFQKSVSSYMLSSTGAPQAPVTAQFLFSVYTEDFQYATSSCFMQKFPDDTAAVSLIKGGDEECTSFVEWSAHAYLHLSAAETKVTIVDFRKGRRRIQTTPVAIRGAEVEMVGPHRCLGVELDGGLDWSSHVETRRRWTGRTKADGFTWRLRASDMCQAPLCSAPQSVVA